MNTDTGTSAAPTATPGASSPGLSAAPGSSGAPHGSNGELLTPGRPSRDASVPTWVPDKFRTGEDFAKSYNQLQSRMGQVGLPPENADGYRWENMPKELTLDPEMSKQFREFALEHGLSAKQYNAVMDRFAQQMDVWAGSLTDWAGGRAEAQLRQTWPSEAEYQKNINDGFKTILAFADSPEEARAFEQINHPAVWKLLARIGKELHEAYGMSANAQHFAGPEDMAELMRHPAYQKVLMGGNPRDPEYLQIKAKIDRARAAQEVMERRRKI